jgi:histidinol dehydrogenase
MAITINTSETTFEAEFARLLGAKREVSEDVDMAVRDIIERVRREGDEALIDYSRRFDRSE